MHGIKDSPFEAQIVEKNLRESLEKKAYIAVGSKSGLNNMHETSRKLNKTKMYFSYSTAPY